MSSAVTDAPVPHGFACRSSRSGSITAALIIVLVVEAVAIHLWLHARLPFIAWTVVVLSVLSVVWVLADYRARGRRRLVITPDTLRLAVGLRPPLDVPRGLIQRAFTPAYRDVPSPDTPYVNLTAPAQPNVLLVLREPLRIPIVLGIRRAVTRIGLHVDDVAGFLHALAAEPAHR